MNTKTRRYPAMLVLLALTLSTLCVWPTQARAEPDVTLGVRGLPYYRGLLGVAYIAGAASLGLGIAELRDQRRVDRKDPGDRPGAGVTAYDRGTARTDIAVGASVLLVAVGLHVMLRLHINEYKRQQLTLTPVASQRFAGFDARLTW